MVVVADAASSGDKKATYDRTQKEVKKPGKNITKSKSPELARGDPVNSERYSQWLCFTVCQVSEPLASLGEALLWQKQGVHTEVPPLCLVLSFFLCLAPNVRLVYVELVPLLGGPPLE